MGLRNRITELMREVNYHPDFIDELMERIEQLKKQLREEYNGKPFDTTRLLKEGNPKACEIWRNAYDSVLMGEGYFTGRVIFLEEVVKYIQNQGRRLKVLEDGCGTGVDLYCLSNLLGDQFSLVGIEPNKSSRELAKSRNPEVKIIPSLDGGKYDVIYTDFFDVDDNFIWEIKDKSKQYAQVLKRGGRLLQNVDFYDGTRRTFSYYMGMHLRFLSEKQIAVVPDKPNCFFMQWEKPS